VVNGYVILRSGFIMFWDWESGEIIRRIDVDAKDTSQVLNTLD